MILSIILSIIFYYIISYHIILYITLYINIYWNNLEDTSVTITTQHAQKGASRWESGISPTMCWEYDPSVMSLWL